MKNITTSIARLIIVGALFTSAVVKAEETEKQDTVIQLHTEVAKELTDVKANLMQDIQQQLTASIKHQLNSAVSNIAESVKALLP